MNTRLVRRDPRTPVSPRGRPPDPTACPDGAGQRWRPVLEQRWDRKLDEVIALTAACEELPAGPAAAPYRQLHARAAVAHDELGALVDALMRIDEGTYGRCEGCGQLMADGWLASDPAVRRCQSCLSGGRADLAEEARQARRDRSQFGYA